MHLVRVTIVDAELLLDNGADIRTRSGCCVGALEFARDARNQPIADILRERGTKLGAIQTRPWGNLDLCRICDCADAFDVAASPFDALRVRTEVTIREDGDCERQIAFACFLFSLGSFASCFAKGGRD